MKRILTVLVFVAVLGMCVASAGAAMDMHSMNFRNGFSIDAPEGHWMGDQVPFGEGHYSGAIAIHYFTDDDLQGTTLEDYIELQQYGEVGTDGDLTIYKNSMDRYVVLTQSGSEYCLVTDPDLDEAKQIAESAKFSGDESADESSESSAPASGNEELKSQDFYGFFTMDVPKDSDFGDTGDYSKRVVADSLYYVDEVNNITIQYINNDAYDDGVVKDTVESLKQQGAEVSTVDDVYAITGNGTNEVIFHSQPKTFTIISNQLDIDTLVDMASSIEITDEN